MKLYEQQYGFKGIFEHYVMKGMAEFLINPAASQMWVAVDDDTVVGSIAIVKIGEDLAQLRWFIVDTPAQGKGIGTALMDTAMQFCADNRYNRIYLWTAGNLDAARHLYKKYGFVLTETKENAEWTDNLVTEEKWERNT